MYSRLLRGCNIISPIAVWYSCGMLSTTKLVVCIEKVCLPEQREMTATKYVKI